MKSSLGPLELVIIQGSPFCNINCTYCYLPHRNSTKKISPDTVANIFSAIGESSLYADKLTVVWHAGEPMALPIPYYQQLFQVINSIIPSKLQLSHSFQTNGTLITDDWCDFIKRTDIRIGVSVDGPEFIHDKFRVKRNGKGSFAEAMHGISLLKKNDIDFHIISVITDYALDYPDEIFNFFLETGIQRVGFNIEEVEGTNHESSLSRVSDTRVYAFYQRMLELQKASVSKIVIREFESTFKRIVGNPFVNLQDQIKRMSKGHLLRPFGILSVDVDGNFTTFSPELLGQESADYGDFILGNVKTDSLKAAIQKPKFKKIFNDINEGIENCRTSCKYFNVCGGGAPSNKYYENGSFRSSETLYCRYSIQMPVDIILNDMEHEMSLVS